MTARVGGAIRSMLNVWLGRHGVTASPSAPHRAWALHAYTSSPAQIPSRRRRQRSPQIVASAFACSRGSRARTCPHTSIAFCAHVSSLCGYAHLRWCREWPCGTREGMRGLGGRAKRGSPSVSAGDLRPSDSRVAADKSKTWACPVAFASLAFFSICRHVRQRMLHVPRGEGRALGLQRRSCPLAEPRAEVEVLTTASSPRRGLAGALVEPAVQGRPRLPCPPTLHRRGVPGIRTRHLRHCPRLEDNWQERRAGRERKHTNIGVPQNSVEIERGGLLPMRMPGSRVRRRLLPAAWTGCAGGARRSARTATS